METPLYLGVFLFNKNMENKNKLEAKIWYRFLKVLYILICCLIPVFTILQFWRGYKPWETIVFTILFIVFFIIIIRLIKIIIIYIIIGQKPKWRDELSKFF